MSSDEEAVDPKTSKTIVKRRPKIFLAESISELNHRLDDYRREILREHVPQPEPGSPQATSFVCRQLNFNAYNMSWYTNLGCVERNVVMANPAPYIFPSEASFTALTKSVQSS